MTERQPVSEMTTPVEMVFRPHTGEVRVTCFEDLLAHGITVHPNAVAQAWGPEAADAYQQTLRGKRMPASEANNGDVS